MTTLVEPFEVICADTSELDRSDWLRLRRSEGVGSSDAAPVLRQSAWRSEYSVYCEKVGLLADTPDTRRFRGGRMYEEPTLRLWCEDSGTPFESVRRNLMLRSIEHPFMVANPDGLTDDAVIEVKTAHSVDRGRWEASVPTSYVIQAHHLMVVTGRRVCILPVAFDWTGPIEYTIEWDDAVAEPMILIEREFWRRVTESDAPDPDGSESSMLALREQYRGVDEGSMIELPMSAIELFEQMEVSREMGDLHLADANACKAKIMALLGEAEFGTLDGAIVVTWKADRNGRRTMRFLDRSA